MFSYNNDFIKKMEDVYGRIVASKELLNPRYHEYKSNAIMLEDIKGGLLNERMQKLYDARVKDIHYRNQQKFDANMAIEDLAKNSGIGVSQKLFPPFGSPAFFKLGEELGKNPLLKKEYDRLATLYPPSTAEEMASRFKLQNELLNKYGTTSEEQIEKIKRREIESEKAELKRIINEEKEEKRRIKDEEKEFEKKEIEKLKKKESMDSENFTNYTRKLEKLKKEQIAVENLIKKEEDEEEKSYLQFTNNELNDNINKIKEKMSKLKQRKQKQEERIDKKNKGKTYELPKTFFNEDNEEILEEKELLPEEIEDSEKKKLGLGLHKNKKQNKKQKAGSLGAGPTPNINIATLLLKIKNNKKSNNELKDEGGKIDSSKKNNKIKRIKNLLKKL
jgi:hypothetical protein